MISRIRGSTIRAYRQTEFDEYRLIRGPVPGYIPDGSRWKALKDALNGVNDLRLEGRVWELTYHVPKNRSTLEIVRNYQAALAKAGFKTLYECSGEACGGPLPR